MVAPRALLLSYNALDNCCFQPDHALGPIAQQVAPVFDLLGAAARFGYHVSYEEGHNYGRDNREALYRFVHRHFLDGAARFDPREIDVTRELREAAQLVTPLPEPNADFRSLARSIASGVARPGRPDRTRLAALLRAPRYDVRPEKARSNRDATFWKLRMDHWTVPAVELEPDGVSRGATLVVADGGRRMTAAAAQRLKAAGHRVLAVDPFNVGESALGRFSVQYALLTASLGERALGIQAAQVAAAARWLAARHGGPVEVASLGPRTSFAALVEAALEPAAIRAVETEGQWRTLTALLEDDVTVDQMPEMFAFGLLAEFDIEQVEQLVAPRPITAR